MLAVPITITSYTFSVAGEVIVLLLPFRDAASLATLAGATSSRRVIPRLRPGQASIAGVTMCGPGRKTSLEVLAATLA